MRISSYAVARPAYYDRNATGTFLSFAGIVAPHAATVRFTTTVAAGKKSYIELAHSYADRQTVAAPGFNSVSWTRVFNGAVYASVIFVRVDQNAVGPMFDRVVTGSTTLYAGEVFESVTIDGSTGGTINWYVSAKLTSFDA